MIPKIIWQTYETNYEDLIDDAKQCSQTWIDKNPGWEYRYMSATDRENFILNYFGQEWLDIYNMCPKNIMKANIWRVLVIYKYGGMYVDLDTVCNIPIDDWIKEKDMIVCIDDDMINYAFFAFLSTPSNIALLDMMNNIKKAFQNPNFLNDRAVFDLTGETIWTDAIEKNKDNIFIFNDYKMFESQLLKHFGTFKNWHEKGYSQWTKM